MCACHDVCGEVRGQAQGSGSPACPMYARLAGLRGSLLLLPPIPWNTRLQTWATTSSFACVLGIQTQVLVLVQQTTESSPQPRLRRCLNADWIIAKLMTWSDVISNPVKFE